MSDEQETQPKHAAKEDVLSIDGRIFNLERESSEYRVHLIKFQDALIDQLVTVSVLELALAVLLALMVWERYKESTHA